MASSIINPEQVTAHNDQDWQNLYRMAGAATFIMVLIIPLQIIVYMTWQIPESALDSFLLFQDNKLVGLLVFELPYLVSNVLSIALFIALYTVLRKVNPTIVAIATTMGLISVAIVFNARPGFDLLYLSDQYTAATNAAQRAMYLAAGEAKLALINGTAQQAHYILGSIAFLLISIVMLSSEKFNKTTAYMGIVANTLAFGIYVPVIGIYLSIFSVFPFLTIWMILTAWQFLKFGRTTRMMTSITSNALPGTNLLQERGQ